MINAGPVTRVMPSSARSGCWIAWCQVILFGVSGMVILAERTALIYCVGFYLWNEETQWAGLTLALLLPGIPVQVLSLRWYSDDGEDYHWFLNITHILQLGIFQRLWDCMMSVWNMQGTSEELGAAVMQQADVSALRLLEALVLTLPQTLLQTYILAVTDVELDSPGFHWLTASFWLVAQQPDICTGPWRWRLFNAAVGLVHIFLFLNVKDSPSRYRMAGFYVAMLLENAALLVVASDFLSEKSWGSITLPSAVLFSFLFGTISLVVYYRFLHPKSTEIAQGQGLRRRSHPMGSTCLEGLEVGESSYSLGGGGGDKSIRQAAPSSLHNHGSFSLSGVAGSLLEHPGSCGPRLGNPCPCRHHHWLLIRLALKTGDVGKINRAYGAGGVAAILDESYCNSEAKSTNGGGGGETTACGGSCDMISGTSGASVTRSHGTKGGLAPLSDCKEEFQSVSEEATSAATPAEEGSGEESGDSLEGMESPLESPVSDSFKRSSPEGKSVFGDSPEPYFCPSTTLSSSTLYFSADPQSPSSTSNPRLDRASPPMGTAGLSSIPSDPALHRAVRGLQRGQMGPRFTSTPKLDSVSPGDSPPSVPHLSGPRRQLIRSRRDHDDGF
ncbi:XK-related protein 5a isoform X2 [Esox lucius]|uniref:XK-related protein 5a isoform X2 n=1 Tax=Esox lucius TaxID=8010 RepID=UPI0005776134|nr:XK-related protein 5a isoform X2 [Esox lucius]